MNNSYTVYVLFSLKDKGLYVGCASQLNVRLKRHNSGLVEATKSRRPLELIYFEVIQGKADAFKRERYFKSLWSSRFKDYLRKLNLR